MAFGVVGIGLDITPVPDRAFDADYREVCFGGGVHYIVVPAQQFLGNRILVIFGSGLLPMGKACRDMAERLIDLEAFCDGKRPTCVLEHNDAL